MHFPETLALLGVLTAAVLALRFWWAKLPAGVERWILGLAVATVVLRLLGVAGGWYTISPRADALLAWASVAGYELLLMRFSLMRPRWLTATSAFVLLLPMLGSTFLFSLTGLFDTTAMDLSSIGGNYVVERTPWGSGRKGVDLVVFYRPPLAPFLRKRVQRSSFSDEQCDTAHATVTRVVGARLVRFVCPGRPGRQEAIELLLPLR